MFYDRVDATKRVNIFDPTHYRHVLSESGVVEGPADCLHLQTSFICMRTMINGAQSLFVTDEYRDEIVAAATRFLFPSRTVILDSSWIDTLITIPL